MQKHTRPNMPAAAAVGACLLALTGAARVARAQSPAVTYVSGGTVAGCAKPLPIVAAADHRASCQVRTGPGDVEIHVRETDVFYITGGAATFVTGGTPVDVDSRNPLQLKAKSLDGGDVHELTRGDVIVIPAGVPHWFKNVPASISMVSIKIIKP